MKMNWKKVADYLQRHGIDEGKRAMEQREKGNMEVANRLLISGNMSCILAQAIEEGLK